MIINLIVLERIAQLIDILDIKEILRIIGSIPPMPEKITNGNAHRQLLKACRPINTAEKRAIIKIAAKAASGRPICLMKLQ